MPFISASDVTRKFRSSVLPSDWMVMLYGLGMVLLISVFHDRVPHWGVFAGAHAAIVVICALLARASSRFWKIVRDFDLIAYIVAFFFMACLLVHRIHPADYDDLLIRWDRAMGGLTLLKSMESYTTPWLTDVAKMSWIAYYAIPFIPMIPLYRRATPDDFHEGKLLYAMVFLLSYVGYFVVPAQGPGYFEKELGIAQPNWKESKVAEGTKKVIDVLEGDARDTFPSGHVAVAAITIFLCLRNRLWRASLLGIPLSLMVIASTIYLRYHYLSDVLAGLALGVVVAIAGCAWYHRHGERQIIA